MPYVRATDGVRLHYRETGRRSGPPVLMIQGLGADKHLWDLQRLALAPWYRTIALDNRGAGRSDKPYGAYSLEQMADDAVAVLDDAGVESAHVIGASMGGAITQIMALRHPDRVRSLTLACTACRHHPWRKELLAEWAETASDSRHGRDDRRGGPLGDRPTVVPAHRPGDRLDGPARALAARRTRSSARSPRSCRSTTGSPTASATITAPDDGHGRQPGHPHAPRRLRGDRRADPDRRAGRDQRRGARVHDRARHHVQPDHARLPRDGPSAPSSTSTASSTPPRRPRPV